ncbi:MAG: UDP-N-acetylglucosamine 2-epimerase (non-hydrolyzing) [Minisyncoccia bacterium]|jgi:UDP-N-acetylglucosamine 2-epimerase (non-hydrolysing)
MKPAEKKKGPKIAIILGTRPEIIKMSPLIRACDKEGCDYFILHSGQHYSPEMDKKIFGDLGIPYPQYNLHSGGQEFRKQMSAMVFGIQEILKKEKPDAVLVQGDTYTVLAGVLSAAKLGIPIGHIEAGLRSNDLSMPEEVNRIIADSISDYLFVPSEHARANLLAENIPAGKIHLTGNTVVDAVNHSLPLSGRTASDIFTRMGVEKNKYILATAHRAEKVDTKETRKKIFKSLILASHYMKMPVVYPVHPRTWKHIENWVHTIPKEIKLVAPLGYFDFLQLESQAALILTDSGGIQEEACILGVPCVTMRENTERPETVELGTNILAGLEPESVLAGVKSILAKPLPSGEPYGDGHAAERIVRILLEAYKASKPTQPL